MKIAVDFSAIHQSHLHEYILRFLFGGLITAAAGLIAKHYGAAPAGLFLAFPAIFPASATLIEKHEIEKKHKAGQHGTMRGRVVASVDAAGAAMGSLGLLGFGLVTWLMLPRFSAWLVLPVAAALWFAIAFAMWWLRKRM